MGGRRGGVKGIALGGVALANGASRGGSGRWWHLCSMRGGGEAVQEAGSSGGRARRKGKQGRRAAARRGGKGRCQRGEEWGQGGLGRLGGAPIGGASSRWVGKTGGGGTAEAPVMLEVGDEVGDLTVICEKFRGLKVK